MIRFLVFSDLHYDEVADGDNRIEEILASARKRDLDFIVSLGDLCSPVNENRKVLEQFKSLGVPFYNVIGNHETDNCKLSEILEFYFIDNPYYSVVCKGYKLIFLNSCYLRNDGKEETFYKKNFKSEHAIYPVIPKEEISWLQEELDDDMKCVIFSHHSFVNDFPKRGIYNREEIRKNFAAEKVLLCVNGHDHGDDYSYVDGISYLTVNSANYAWLGGQIASSKELQEKYSYLQGMLQYKQAMSAYIEIDADEIRISGMDGEYLSVTPDDIELHDYRWNGVSIRPQISSRLIKLIDAAKDIEWLFFDVGSTLVSEEKPFTHRLHEIAEAVNEPFETIEAKVLQLYKEKKKGERVLINECGMEKPRWRSEDEELFPESYTCLEKLSRRYKIGVIANQRPGTAARLEKHGILKFIDIVIASAEEGVEKPDRKIFELALSRADCRPENAVMIGDRVDNDIIPAKKIGMKTVRVKQGMWKYWEVSSPEEQADYEVDNLNEVLALFE